MTYSGLMPSGSRARVRLPVARRGWRRRTCPGTGAAPAAPRRATPRARPRCPTWWRTGPRGRAARAAARGSCTARRCSVSVSPPLAERLVGGAGQVDDRQPAVPQDHRGVGSTSSTTAPASGPRWRDPVDHRRDEHLAVGLLVRARDAAHAQASAPATGTAARAARARQLVEDPQVALLLVLPGQVLLDALPPPATHLGARGRVVDEVDDGAGVLVDVVGPHVDGGVGRGDPRLAQVERDDGQPEGHVLHRLVHRRDVVERVERVRGQPDVGRREDLADERVGNATGQVDDVREAELVARARRARRSSRRSP